MNALLSPSSLLCERCHGHGYVRTTFGRVNCLECSGASPWKPASTPPACEPGSHGGISIECVGLVRSGAYRGPEIVAYWPAVGTWTVTRKDPGGDYFDAAIEVSHWIELPELPLDEAGTDVPGSNLLNQCDGCATKSPLDGKLHMDENGRPFMACQKHLYEDFGITHEDLRDAERYRALRNQAHPSMPVVRPPKQDHLTYSPEGLDAAIDALIKKKVGA